MGWSFYQARRYEESIAEHRKMVEIDSRFAFGRLTFSWALMQTGKYDEAIEEARKAVELSGGSPFILAALGSAYAKAGRTEEAHKVLRELKGLSHRRYVSPYHLALTYCNLGDLEQAFAHLEETFANRDAWIVWLGVEPQLDPLRSDPRFRALLRSSARLWRVIELTHRAAQQ
ncbi:MAG: tetratricopeptide repeat protein [Pyrinomonadaceae bacterium]